MKKRNPTDLSKTPYNEYEQHKDRFDDMISVSSAINKSIGQLGINTEKNVLFVK
jgi:hypothetical protein